MGGYGSGRYGGRPTVERAVRLDIDSMMCWGAIQPGFHLGGEMRLHQLYGDDLDVKYESLAGDPWNSWLRLRYSIADYRSGEELKIDDKVYRIGIGAQSRLSPRPAAALSRRVRTCHDAGRKGRPDQPANAALATLVRLSRHSRHPGLFGSPQERHSANVRVYEGTP